MVDEHQRDRIVDDLLKKHPVEKYSDWDLFGLGFRHKIDVEHYLCGRFYGATTTYGLGRKKATVTRRAKRIWSRISQPIGRIVEAGGTGVYKVTERYKFMMPPLAFIFAHDKEEAVQLAEMFFGFLISKESSLDVSYIEQGGPDNIKRYNDKLLTRYGTLRDESSKKIVEEQEKLERASIMLKYLDNFSPDSFKS